MEDRNLGDSLSSIFPAWNSSPIIKDLAVSDNCASDLNRKIILSILSQFDSGIA